MPEKEENSGKTNNSNDSKAVYYGSAYPQATVSARKKGADQYAGGRCGCSFDSKKNAASD